MGLECRVWLDGEDCGVVPIVDFDGKLVFGDACYWLIDLLQSPGDDDHDRYARAEARIVQSIGRNTVAGAFLLEGRTIRWRLAGAGPTRGQACVL